MKNLNHLPLLQFLVKVKVWVTSLLGSPASFQRLMETVLRNIDNVLVYIDDVILHTATHDEHLHKCLKKFLKVFSKPLESEFGQMCFWQHGIWGSCSHLRA
jgi:hypothetical protein